MLRPSSQTQFNDSRGGCPFQLLDRQRTLYCILPRSAFTRIGMQANSSMSI